MCSNHLATMERPYWHRLDCRWMAVWAEERAAMSAVAVGAADNVAEAAAAVAAATETCHHRHHQQLQFQPRLLRRLGEWISERKHRDKWYNLNVRLTWNDERNIKRSTCIKKITAYSNRYSWTLISTIKHLFIVSRTIMSNNDKHIHMPQRLTLRFFVLLKAWTFMVHYSYFSANQIHRPQCQLDSKHLFYSTPRRYIWEKVKSYN